MQRGRKLTFSLIAALCAAGTLILSLRHNAAALSDNDITQIYTPSLSAPSAPLTVFHLGHSLVGRDMPAMLQQLTAARFDSPHLYHSQLGWGTPLRAHWESDEAIAGFETENAHSAYRDAKEALASGRYDTVVLTEMVEIRDAIAYFNSAEYLAKWASAARAGHSNVRIYLYETWHELNTPEGWLPRLDTDLTQHWQNDILFPAIAQDPMRHPIYIIPAGQVMAALVRRIEKEAPAPDLSTREDLFLRTADGAIDPIHINDLGNYLVALTHFAVLYQQSPIGLPHALHRANGSAMTPISATTAKVMQETVWEVVQHAKYTGLPTEK